MTKPGASANHVTGRRRAEMAREIHRRRDAGMTRSAVAAELGITDGQLNAIVADCPWSPAEPTSGGLTAECPECDTEVALSGGQLEPHGPRDGAECVGSRRHQPTSHNDD